MAILFKHFHGAVAIFSQNCLNIAVILAPSYEFFCIKCAQFSLKFTEIN